MSIQRRSFLRGSAAGLGALATSSSLSRLVRSASAASTCRYAGHRSLICMFLLGGNDGNQLLVPTDTASGGRRSRYVAQRPTLALAPSELLPAGEDDRGPLGLHPKMTYLHQALTGVNGRAAMVCNVGPVSRPTTKALYLAASHAKPTNLLSHSDQQDAWASAAPIPSEAGLAVARSGWGGRLGLAMNPLNELLAGQRYPSATHVGGRRLFTASQSPSLVVGKDGTMEFVFDRQPLEAFEQLRRAKAKQLAEAYQFTLESAYADELRLAVNLSELRKNAVDSAWNALPGHANIEALTQGLPSDWTLPRQVLSVLKDIVAAATPRASGLGLKRQVFSIGLGGFDTHGQQASTQAGLLEQVDTAIHVFIEGMRLIQAAWPTGTLPPQSTLFAMSDFGRTLKENSDGGTDHGWGNHLFVVGSRVRAGLLHGVYPNLDETESTDDRGRWIPTTSVDQYVRNLARWMGASDPELATIFPNHAGYLRFANDERMAAHFKREEVLLMMADNTATCQ